MESSFVMHDLTSVRGVLVRNALLDECIHVESSFLMYDLTSVYMWSSSFVMYDFTSVCGVLVRYA